MNWNLVVLIVAILVSLAISATLFMFVGVTDDSERSQQPVLFAGGVLNGTSLNVDYSMQPSYMASKDVIATLYVNGQTLTQTIPKGVAISNDFYLEVPASSDNIKFTLSLAGGVTISTSGTAVRVGH